MYLQKNLRRLFLTLLAVALLVTAGAHFLSKYIEKKPPRSFDHSDQCVIG
jgi:hypothetical protein